MIGLFALAAASLSTCRAEDARYVLRHAPSVSAYFREVDGGPDWPGGLALAIRFGGSGHVFWWLPWTGGADDRQNLASTTDVTAPGWRPPSPDGGPRPHGDMGYLGFDARYDVIDDIPRRERPAPAHMLLAGIGAVEFDHGRGPRVPSTRQFFDLAGCSAQAVAATASRRARTRPMIHQSSTLLTAPIAASSHSPAR